MNMHKLFVTNTARGIACASLMLLAPLATRAANTQPTPLTQATISDLAGNVTIYPKSAPDQTAPAKVQDIFDTTHGMSTARKSHAQLTAADGSVIRVGSDTEFSLEPNSRTVNLSKGSVLFTAPKGFNSSITSGSATATVTGFTVITVATPDGGFKILVLEGTAKVTLPNGQTVNLGPGQMTFVLPASKGGGAGPVLNFDLKQQVATSALVNGFTLSLPSQDLIIDATNTQEKQISSGDLNRTGQVVVGAVSPDQVVLTDSTTFDNVNNVNNPVTASADLVLGPTLDVPLPSANETPANGTVFTAGNFGLPNGVIPNNQILVTGLIGNNVSASGLVNLSSIDGLSSVDILAQNTFTFTNAPNTENITIASPDIAHPDADSSFTEFTGMSTSLILSLAAKSGFVFPSESDVEAV
ncbi:MAG TPA: FecR family protein, partial [Opitutales bacterium]|nr:FecR family protein [Opitutales bacterium]